MRRSTQQSGVTLVEVVIAISITAAILVVIGFSITSYVDARNALLNNSKATYLVEEGHEIIRALRDTDWATFDALSTDTYHYLNISTSSIAFSVTPEVIDTEFVRSFIIRDVYRDANDDFATSSTPGAAVDSDTKEIRVFVNSPNGTTSMAALLANIYQQ